MIHTLLAALVALTLWAGQAGAKNPQPADEPETQAKEKPAPKMKQ